MEDGTVIQAFENDKIIQDTEMPESTREEQPKSAPQVTFMGNNYDLTALGALFSSLIAIFMCMSCSMGFYCLPVIPILLGIFGLIMSKDSVNAERTRLFSWIGVGTGAVFVLLIALGVLLYVAFVVFAVIMGAQVSY